MMWFYFINLERCQQVKRLLKVSKKTATIQKLAFIEVIYYKKPF